jgi:hypothetical protein
MSGLTRWVSRNRIFFLIIVYLILFPSPTYADAGTPLMWAGMLHLLVGNLMIGILEGGLIAFFLGIRKRIAIPLLICANYVSMLAGLFLIPLMRDYIFIPAFGCPSLYNVGTFLWLFYISLFLITVVIEWPFCFLAMSRLAGKFKKSIYASFAVQAISYLLLIPFYFGASATSLFAKLERDPSLVKTCTDRATILFIHPETGDVYRIRPNGTGLAKVLTLGAQEAAAKLFLRHHEGGDTGDLWIQKDYSEKSEQMLLPKFAASYLLQISSSQSQACSVYYQSHLKYQAACLGHVSNRSCLPQDLIPNAWAQPPFAYHLNFSAK